MTKKQYNKLRKEMCIRIMQLPPTDAKSAKKAWKTIDRMGVPRWHEGMRSYAEAWEQLTPARNLVGM